MKFDRELLQVLCPFGEWSHSKGMQVVDEEAARRMKRAAWSPLGQIPVYVGHPDDAPSTRKISPVGKIKKICRTKDGIAVVAAYSQKAYDDIVSGRLSAMSPRWKMELLGSGKYRPVKLLSVGLTNNPNIPESGRIIDAAPRSETLGRAKKSGENIGERIARCGERLRQASQKAAEIGARAKSAKIAERLAERASDASQPTPSERRARAAKLAEIAAERSRRLGEPYTKSFAAVKRRAI